MLGRTPGRGQPYVSVLVIGAVTVLLILRASVDHIVAYCVVAALVAMVIVSVACGRLALQGWPGEGTQLPGGPVIPAVSGVTCLAQFPSLGVHDTVVGLLLVLAGLVLYYGRHLEAYGRGVVERVRALLRERATPLHRALQRRNQPAAPPDASAPAGERS